MPRVSHELAAVGVDGFEEQVYRALLTRDAAVPAEIAGEVGSSPDRVRRALDRLHDLGLVGRLHGSRRRYAAIDPRSAVETLVQTRNAELTRVREAATDLYRVFDTVRHRDDRDVEIVTGSEALGRWFVQLQQAASEQVRTLDRPPYALTTANPVEQTAMQRGVNYRVVYAPEALEWPGVFDDIQSLVGAGEEARVLPGLRVKLAIADDSLAVMPLSLDLANVRAAVIRPSALLDGLIDYWQLCWAVATPLPGAGAPVGSTPGDGPSEEERLLLSLLVSGLKDESVARQLGWSLRTMRRRVSALNERLGAANRFQAGVIATQRGWLGPRNEASP
jgi:predicted transcriptional regulator